MSNPYFKFKEFTVIQDKCAMKVTTLACIQGAWLPCSSPNRILDIGAGTGLLSLMAAQQFDCPIDAVEIDDDAYNQLTDNLASSPWADRITAYHEDITIFARHQKQKYDLIISNPPFFANHLKSPNPHINKARHDTGLTLARLLYLIDDLLSDSGSASILLPPPQTTQLINRVKDRSLRVIGQLVIFDRPKQAPKAMVTLLAGGQKKVMNTTLVIKSDDGSYTSDFKALLKDYYLNL